ncbi:MAG TPA: EboA domain-containing protein [Gaiellaceae bacterium]|nr:EboA domain-containing protein [Gaiellaceae bacterium]
MIATEELLWEQVRTRATPEQVSWLEDAVASVLGEPESIGPLFPAVGRRVGRAPLDPAADPADVHAWTVDDAGRTLLLLALGEDAPSELDALYRHGDTAERRGLLRALPFLPVGDTGIPLVEDAVRTNELSLIAAALGPYAFSRLGDDAVAQAVLKCVFVGIPLGGLEGLDGRVTPDVSRMLAAFVHERVAAGRTVPADVWPVIDRYPPEDELAEIAAELDHPVTERREAARAALALRDQQRST